MQKKSALNNYSNEIEAYKKQSTIDKLKIVKLENELNEKISKIERIKSSFTSDINTMRHELNNMIKENNHLKKTTGVNMKDYEFKITSLEALELKNAKLEREYFDLSRQYKLKEKELIKIKSSLIPVTKNQNSISNKSFKEGNFSELFKLAEL